MGNGEGWRRKFSLSHECGELSRMCGNVLHAIAVEPHQEFEASSWPAHVQAGWGPDRTCELLGCDTELNESVTGLYCPLLKKGLYTPSQ